MIHRSPDRRRQIRLGKDRNWAQWKAKIGRNGGHRGRA
jgi:hypothetical protein